MRLEISLPAEATSEARGDGMHAAWGETTLSWGQLVALPDDRTRWIQRALRTNLAVGSVLTLVRDVIDRTATGWPLRVVVTQVQLDSRASAARWRLHGFYAFFEHAAIAVVEGPTREALDEVLPIMRSGRPRWDALGALAQLWDIPVGASPPGADDPGGPTAIDTAAAHHAAGIVHARAGDVKLALQDWDAAAALDPLYVDGLYNAGVALHRTGDVAAALAYWERGLARAPRDFWFLRKLVQAHNALGQFRDAGRMRQRLLEVWATSTSSAVRGASSYVFHQQVVDGIEVHGSEVLVERAGPPVLIFEPVIATAGASECIRLRVDPAGDHGAQFTLHRGESRRVLETLPRRPGFTELVERAHALIRAAIAARDR